MKTVLGLCDYTGNMVRPWADAGYRCVCVDLQHESTYQEGNITFIGADILRWMPPLEGYEIVFAFPPCTDLAVSGARHFRNKGLSRLITALQLVERCREIAEWSGAPWMLENPVSTISSYWRKPDYQFHPHQYAGLEPADNYTKKTCLWTGGGFAMPDPAPGFNLTAPDDRIHKAAPGPERANFRSATPMGFARAVFMANSDRRKAA